MSHKVYNKPVLDKLGVMPDTKVTVIGIADGNFWRQLTERTSNVTRGTLRKDTDVIFFGADSTKELSRLKTLKAHLKPDGGIWVVSRKGKEATLKDIDVIAAAKKAGLVDNKVVGFSETHTALRLVIPVNERK